AALLATRRTALIRQAESCVPPEYSCRTRDEGRLGQMLMALMVTLALGLWLAPLLVLVMVSLLTILTLVSTTLLKAMAFRRTLRDLREGRAHAPDEPMNGKWTVISMMVHMFREENIADRLVGRLHRLSYPRELTVMLLVVEET